MNIVSELILPSQLVAPGNFRAAGKVLSAYYLSGPPKFPSPGTTSRAQRLGKRYEAKIVKAIKKLDFDTMLFGPWISFVSAKTEAMRCCQPDMVLLDEKLKRGIIFEIKYTHTKLAYHQLYELYLPVLQKIHPEFKFTLVEVTRGFDAAIAFPLKSFPVFYDFPTCQIKMLAAEPESFGVLQWKI